MNNGSTKPTNGLGYKLIVSLAKKAGFRINPAFSSAEALIDDWYYNGDIIEQDEDGTYCFAKRFGGFIRSRGENMSSHLVEGLSYEHQAINARAVFPIAVAKGSEEDNATFIVFKPGS